MNLKKVLLSSLIVAGTVSFSDNYYVRLSSNNFEVSEYISAPEEPVTELTITEMYPFSSLNLASGFTSDGTRHYRSGSASATYVAPESYSTIKFTIPTEAGTTSNARLDLTVSINGVYGTTCDVPTGTYNLFYCELEINDVNKDDIIKIEGVGAGKYTIFGNLNHTDETLTIEHIN